MRKIPSPPSTTAVGVLTGAAKSAFRKASSARVSSACDPAEVAGLRGCRGIGRDRLGDVLPGLAALDVLERRVGLGLGVGLLGRGRSRSRRGRSTGLTSMTQAWRCSGVVASMVSRASMSSGVAVTPSPAASLRLELGVDQPLERDRRQLLALLRRWPAAGPRPGSGSGARRGRSVEIRRSASSSRHASTCEPVAEARPC